MSAENAANNTSTSAKRHTSSPLEQQNSIQEATSRLIDLLRNNNSDPVEVGQILSQVREGVLPSPTDEESLGELKVVIDKIATVIFVHLLTTLASSNFLFWYIANQRVEDALAAQRAVALLRTEARLHMNAAERCEAVIKRLLDTQGRIAMQEEEETEEEDEGGTAAATTTTTAEAFRSSVIRPIELEHGHSSNLATQVANAANEKMVFVSLRRKATATVAKIMKDTERAFNMEFQRALAVGKGTNSSSNNLSAELLHPANDTKEILHVTMPKFDKASIVLLSTIWTEKRQSRSNAS